MVVSQLQNLVHCQDICKGYEPKAPWPLRTLISQYHNVVDGAKLAEVGSKLCQLQIVRQSTNEDLPKLRVYFLILRKGELRYAIHNQLALGSCWPNGQVLIAIEAGLVLTLLLL